MSFSIVYAKLVPGVDTVPVLQVSGVLSHSVLALAGELSVVAGCEAADDDVAALDAVDEPAALLLLPAAGAEAVAEPPPVVAGELPLLLLPLHADTDSAAVSARTAPV
jgi:hypothetical protein